MAATGPSARIARYSACAPNLPSQYPKTWSPTAKAVTRGPVAATSPAYSVPRTVARGRRSPDISRMTGGLADR